MVYFFSNLHEIANDSGRNDLLNGIPNIDKNKIA